MKNAQNAGGPLSDTELEGGDAKSDPRGTSLSRHDSVEALMQPLMQPEIETITKNEVEREIGFLGIPKMQYYWVL